VIIRLWPFSWEQFTPFLTFPPEIRKIVYTIGQYEQDLLAASSLRWQGESVPES
jgi:transposase-like protein